MPLAQIEVDTPGNIFITYEDFIPSLISRILLFAIPLAGLVFMVIIIVSGFTMLTSVGDPAKIQSATKTLTNALIGFLLVLTTYFIIQIIQTVFGLTIL